MYIIINFKLQINPNIVDLSEYLQDTTDPWSLAERRTPVLERRKPWNSGQWGL